MKKYSVLDCIKYFIEHVGILTFMFSLNAAIVSIIIELLTYARISAYFNEWKIPKEFIEVRGVYSYYKVLASVLVSLALLLVIIRKKSHSDFLSSCMTSRSILLRKLQDAKTEENIDFNKIEEMTAEIKRVSSAKILIVAIQWGIMMTLCYPVFYICISVLSYASEKYWVAYIIFNVVIILDVILDVYWAVKNEKNYQAKGFDKEHILNEYDEFLAFPDQNEDFVINEKNIKKILINLLAGYIMISFICLNDVFQDEQNGFWNYEAQNGYVYVQVYQTSDFIIMKKAEWDNNEVIIYLNEQICMPISGNCLVYKDAKRITKIR